MVKIAEKGCFFQSFFRDLFLYTAVVCKTHRLDKLMNKVGSLELEPMALLKQKKHGVFSFRKDVSKTKTETCKKQKPWKKFPAAKSSLKRFGDFSGTLEDETRQTCPASGTWCWVVLGHFSSDILLMVRSALRRENFPPFGCIPKPLP